MQYNGYVSTSQMKSHYTGSHSHQANFISNISNLICIFIVFVMEYVFVVYFRCVFSFRRLHALSSWKSMTKEKKME